MCERAAGASRAVICRVQSVVAKWLLVCDVSGANFHHLLSYCLGLFDGSSQTVLTSPGLGHLHLPGDPLIVLA